MSIMRGGKPTAAIRAFRTPSFAGGLMFGLLIAVLIISLLASSAMAANYISNPYSVVNVQGNRVSINVTYRENVILSDVSLIRYPDDEVGMQTTYSMPENPRCGDGMKSFIFTETLRREGNYSFMISVEDCVNNQRSDGRNFTVVLIPPPGCGDGYVNTSAGEECDDRNNENGDGCSAMCFQEVCGNNRVDAGEVCDGTGLNGQTCVSFGFEGGDLACISGGCSNFDFSGCFGNISARCGNAVIDPGEECDGTNWGSIYNCISFDSSFTGGDLTCDPVSCRFITSACMGYEEGNCGDQQVGVGEECDGSARLTCSAFDRFFGDLITCADDCRYNTSDCLKPDPVCGDGEPNPSIGEACDGYQFAGGIRSCADLESYTGGPLSCNDDCSLDTSACGFGASMPEYCFDGVKNASETDVDCGGGLCSCCQVNRKCVSNDDCCERYCDAGVCKEPSCDDGVRNGFETDVDCGGGCEQRCEIGANCEANGDCVTNACLNGVCVEPSCDDGAMNGNEIDVDCGGSCPNGCSLGQSCEADIDCESGYCESGVCSVDKTLDSDGDGMPDWWEDKYGLDKFDPSDARGDADKDGFSNLAEYERGLDPTIFDEGGKTHVSNVFMILFGLILLAAATRFLVYYRHTYLPRMKKGKGKPGVAGAPGVAGMPGQGIPRIGQGQPQFRPGQQPRPLQGQGQSQGQAPPRQPQPAAARPSSPAPKPGSKADLLRRLAARRAGKGPRPVAGAAPSRSGVRPVTKSMLRGAGPSARPSSSLPSRPAARPAAPAAAAGAAASTAQPSKPASVTRPTPKPAQKSEAFSKLGALSSKGSPSGKSAADALKELASKGKAKEKVKK